MGEPTGPELATRLRALLPTSFQPGFDEDLDLFTNTPDVVTQCGALTAFSWAFDRCIAAEERESIKNALALVDELLEVAAPVDISIPARQDLYDSVLTCFLENVLPTTKRGHALVVPNLGPKAIAFCERFEPNWLLPDPRARLST